MKTQRIVILGAGGDGLVIAGAVENLARSGKEVMVAGFLDDSQNEEAFFEGYPLLGTLDEWGFLDSDIQFIPAIQKVGDMARRATRIEGLGIPTERWTSIIHPQTMISDTAQIGRGVYIAAFCTLQPRCRIHDFSSLRAGAALGHDTTVSRHGYIGPNAVMCGRSALGVGAHLGPGAVLLDGRCLGDYAIAGINAGITKDVPPYGVVMGNPAKRT